MQGDEKQKLDKHGQWHQSECGHNNNKQLLAMPQVALK